MTEQPKQNLPLGTSDFATLRSSNEIYVDKTEMIYQLACVRGKVFLSRPRRFGKSLLISTFESLFKYGLRDFKGLAIEKHWKDKTYPVIRLDFSDLKDFSSVEDFQKAFVGVITTAFAPIGFKYDSTNTISPFIEQFKAWLDTLSSY